jgi:hypothetical protein
LELNKSILIPRTWFGTGTVTYNFSKLIHRVIILRVSVSATALVTHVKKIQCDDGHSLTHGIRANSLNVVCLKTYLEQYATSNVLKGS